MRTALKSLAVAAGLILLIAGPAAAAIDTRPPSIPGNLRATQVTQTGVALAWSPSTDNVRVVSYSVWAPGLDRVVLVNHPTTSVTINGLHPGTTYAFRVSAFDGVRASEPSTIVNVTTQPDVVAPSAPSGLALADNVHGFPVDGVTASKVLLTWTNSTDDFGPIKYQVLVNGVPNPNVFDTRPAGSPVTTVSKAWVRQLEPGTTYNLSVRAVDSGGNVSAASAPLTVTTDAANDTVAPTTPTLTRVRDGGTGVCPEELHLTWTAATDNVTPATAVEYEVRINGTISDVFKGLSGTIVIYTEIAGANTVTIVAVDAAGNASAPSNAITRDIQWGISYCG
jgi:chitodextrinase